MTKNKEQEVQEGVRVYELAFHLVPTISESEVAVQFSHLKSLIEKRKGAFISEQAPALMRLMYEIPKSVKGQKNWYENSYFGWIKFSLEADEVEAIEKEVKEFESMLRYLLIKTVAEDTMAPAHLTQPKETRKSQDDKEAPAEEVTAETEEVESTDAEEVVEEDVEEETK